MCTSSRGGSRQMNKPLNFDEITDLRRDQFVIAYLHEIFINHSFIYVVFREINI